MAARLVNFCIGLARDPRHTRWICPLLLSADAALTLLIIRKIPYTEIDWTAYMQQIATIANGERDYLKIRGETGPLVYPAAHVYIYRVLYALTDKGRHIRLAQYIFGALYVATLALVMACYRRCHVPPFVFPLLVASKRLHSIFVLRLFNDCFAAGLLFCTIALFQRRRWTWGAIAFSVGVATKMTLLLALPAVALVLLQALGPHGAFRKAGIMLQVQIVLGLPFLITAPTSYLSRSFELSRVFFFRWTVNWRFVGQDVFLSREFATGLLVCHVALLAVFVATRWLLPSRQSPIQALVSVFRPLSPARQASAAAKVTPEFVTTSILTATTIGLLCARSLHYQFYAMLAWATPFLLWRAGLHPVLLYALWGLQELAWNVYPSTSTSSLTVVMILALTVAVVWSGTAGEAMVSGSGRKKPLPRSHIQ